MPRFDPCLSSRALRLPGLAVAAILAGAAALPAGEPAAQAATPAATTSTADTPPASKLKPPVATKQVAPVHPPELMKKLINGRAVIECVITETGSVEDIKVAAASEPQFGEAAVAALKQWEFQPGERAGKPVPVHLQIPFDFRLTPEQIIETAAQRQVFKEITDTIIAAKELPSWPRPTNFLLPRYPQSLKGSGKYGKAVVSIIINKEGKVMNPQIVKATYPEFVLPALVTAAQLEFPPQIMANNERINVSMDIQFDFKADTEKPKENPKKK
ncbi:MAG TPA: TonB family protein [Lacunisphaera sp.]|nr:TonB family protein [Lacunisphaera sp.]